MQWSCGIAPLRLNFLFRTLVWIHKNSKIKRWFPFPSLPARFLCTPFFKGMVCSSDQMGPRLQAVNPTPLQFKNNILLWLCAWNKKLGIWLQKASKKAQNVRFACICLESFCCTWIQWCTMSSNPTWHNSTFAIKKLLDQHLIKFFSLETCFK